MHKEDQQATGGPTSLGVTSKERANPQLSSVDFTAETNLGLSAPNDSISPQKGMDKGTKNTSYDHTFAGTDLHVLIDQTKYVSEGLETVLTQSTTKKEQAPLLYMVIKKRPPLLYMVIKKGLQYNQVRGSCKASVSNTTKL
nr:hypothetical protein [Tanacetum cinerariifolium]